METKDETYMVFTKRMALELRKLGYKIIRTEPNREKPELDIYIFRMQNGFIEDLKRLVEERKLR